MGMEKKDSTFPCASTSPESCYSNGPCTKRRRLRPDSARSSFLQLSHATPGSTQDLAAQPLHLDTLQTLHQMTYTRILNILDALGLDDYERAGEWVKLPCPFAAQTHRSGRDNDPSFNIHINPTGQSGFHCWSCKETGTVVNGLVMRLSGDLQLRTRAFAYELECGFKPFEELIEEEYERPTELIPLDVYESIYPDAWTIAESRDYLLRRGVSREAARLLRLRYDAPSARILFPVMTSEEEAFGYAGRSILPDSKVTHYNYAPLQKSKHLLGAHLLRRKLPVVVVEGQFALARLLTIGARRVCDVVATMGSNMSVRQAGCLIDHGSRVVLLYDNDAAGDAGLFGKWNEARGERKKNGAVDLLSPEVSVSVPSYPPGVNDPDTLTIEQFVRMLQT